jgi:glycerol-3-phosphate acyltransferase PlsY
MSLPLFLIVAALGGYIIGSISFAVLIARSQGVDIFRVGSGNPGATNVLRNLGKGPGYACFLLDAFKGIAAALLGYGLGVVFEFPPPSQDLLAIVALLGAILGHSFSAFLRFRGGKGVATTVGGLFVIMPWVMAVGAAVWVLTFLITRYVSLASILLGLSLPLAAMVLPQYGIAHILLSLVLAALILIRHRSNIERLRAGTEHRSGRKRAS